MPQPNRCEVCGEPTDQPTRMCFDCRVDYRKRAHEVGDVMEAVVWAAKRSRW